MLARAASAIPERPKYEPGRISDPNYVRIFDTTLRDGEQSPGATLTSKEKLDIARNLAKLRVDIIEAGFPIASPDDFAAVQQIANEVGNAVADDGYVPVICGLSRTKKPDLESAWNAVKGARLPRVHTFIATSPVHMEFKLRMSEDEVVAAAVDAVSHLRSLGCEDIEFSPEDAGRSERPFLYRILAEVIAAGATTLNIPDTTGWNLPTEFGGLIADLRANVEGADGVVFSTHCQNDLGLSTANSLAGTPSPCAAAASRCTLCLSPPPLPMRNVCHNSALAPRHAQPAHMRWRRRCHPAHTSSRASSNHSIRPQAPRRARARSSAPSTASASARATRRSRRWRWPLRCAAPRSSAACARA